MLKTLLLIIRKSRSFDDRTLFILSKGAILLAGFNRDLFCTCVIKLLFRLVNHYRSAFSSAAPPLADLEASSQFIYVIPA